MQPEINSQVWRITMAVQMQQDYNIIVPQEVIWCRPQNQNANGRWGVRGQVGGGEAYLWLVEGHAGMADP